jgi:hypothetical protein
MAIDVSKLTPFPRTVGLADFGITADVVVQPYDFGKVGSLTVPAQQVIGFGANDVINGGLTGQAVYLAFYTTGGVVIEGQVRFEVSNATGTRKTVVGEYRTERLRADQNDRTKAVLMPLRGPLAKQDDILRILFYPDGASAVTIDYDGTNTNLLVPITIYQ